MLSDTVPVPVILPQPIVPTVIFGEPVKPAALPVQELEDPDALPVTLPSILATRVPVVIVKSPVSLLVAVVVPTVNLSALSSQAMIALLPVEPRSIKIPQSLALEVAPLFNSIRLSVTVVLVVATVVVVPLTVKFPDNVSPTAVSKPVLGL